jgi:prepilin-type N-terminal cleavage/methylation domain-containing protein
MKSTRVSQYWHRRAFTIIELTIVMAIVSVISSLVIVNITLSKKTARDTVRKADAAAILASVGQYAQANGTSFIRYNALGCSGTGADPSTAYTGTGCVGASGRAYGLVNVAGNATLTGVGTPSTTNNRVYTGHTIVEALNIAGYLNASPKDPLNKVGTLTGANGAGTVWDYALIRACPNGRQHVSARGQLYAVWVMLENTPTGTSVENLNRIPGWATATPDNGGYDFAAGPTEQTLFTTKSYGVSNGSSRPQDTSEAGSCAATPA